MLKGKKVIFLNRNTPAEDLYFEQVKSKYIFGFNSSVFVNIYVSLAVKDKNKVQNYVFLESFDQLEKLFKNLGFNILKL
jgi:hypothetical protein